MRRHLRQRRVMRFSFSLLFASLLLAGGCSNTPQHYAANCATPLKRWLTPKNGIRDLRTVETVTLDRGGTIHLGGAPLSLDTLRRHLGEADEMNPAPQILLTVDPQADCTTVRAVRLDMDTTAICSKDRLCGEGAGWRGVVAAP
jgi:hypothetical protein